MHDWSNLIDTQGELAILVSKLRWPTTPTLEAFYRKLLENPGSCVVLTLEAPRQPAGPHWKIGWLSSKERDLIRKDLQKINAKRIKAKEQPTSEIPVCQKEPK